MNKEKLINILQPHYREILDDQQLILTDNLTADDVETWDSLNHILLLVKCEEVLSVKFKAEEVAELINFGEFIDLILYKLNNG
tara:strand:+ start:617 stop:865 length:249 start_codon:yes stop_codon:yes gene_type:complete